MLNVLGLSLHICCLNGDPIFEEFGMEHRNLVQTLNSTFAYVVLWSKFQMTVPIALEISKRPVGIKSAKWWLFSAEKHACLASALKRLGLV